MIYRGVTFFLTLIIAIVGCAPMQPEIVPVPEFTIDDQYNYVTNVRLVVGQPIMVQGRVHGNHVTVEPRFEWNSAKQSGQFIWMVTYYGAREISISHLAISFDGRMIDPKYELGGPFPYTLSGLSLEAKVFLPEQFSEAISYSTRLRLLIKGKGVQVDADLNAYAIDCLIKFYRAATARKTKWLTETMQAVKIEKSQGARQVDTKYVNVDVANIRTGPSKTATVTRKNHYLDAIVCIDSLVGDWIAIQNGETDLHWIHKGLLSDSYSAAEEEHAKRQAVKAKEDNRSRSTPYDRLEEQSNKSPVSSGRHASYIRIGTPSDDVANIRGRCVDTQVLGSDENGLIVAWHYPDVTYIMKRWSVGGVDCYRVAEKK
jgi:SH3-like domain-containing protein